MTSRLLTILRGRQLVKTAVDSVTKGRPRLPSVSTTAVVVLSSHQALSYAAAIHRRQYDLSEEDSAADSSVLACSSATKVDSSPSLLRRSLDGLRSWFRHLYEAFMLTWRASETLLRLSPLLLLVPFGSDDLMWRYAIHAIQSLGPVAIKLCQWASTRRDLFPPEWCERLAILQDRGNVPSHKWKETQRTLERAFGKGYEERGLSVDRHAVIGCGSAGQVYRGYVDGKRPVAVKVLHPDFQFHVDRDLTCIRTLASWLHALPVEQIRVVNLPRATANFGTSLYRQSDLTNEAKNLQRFRDNFGGDDIEKVSNVFFPQPVEGWVSEQVLVEDLVSDSVPIARFLEDDTPNGRAIRKELAGPLLRAFLKMVFWDNFVHGDLHPGNVLVRSKWKKPEPSFFAKLWPFHDDKDVEPTLHRTIVFLDAGIADSLTADDQRNLIDLFRAVLLNDGAHAGRLMVERAKHERCSQVPGGVEAFAAGVDAIVDEFHTARKQEGLTLGAVRIGQLLSRVLDLCRIHGVEIDPAMAGVVLSTLVLEGLGRSLEPNLNLLDFARPFVFNMGRV